jgi:hypothetical protein
MRKAIFSPGLLSWVWGPAFRAASLPQPQQIRAKPQKKNFFVPLPMLGLNYMYSPTKKKIGDPYKPLFNVLKALMGK